MKPPTNRQVSDPLLRSFFDVDNLFPSCWVNNDDASFATLNIKEDDLSFYVDIIAAGFTKENFKIYIEDNVINIIATSGCSAAGDNNSFIRSFRLPENIKQDLITASYKNEMLQLAIPKQIPITKKEVLVQ